MLSSEPTAAELERAKRWAAMQVPPVKMSVAMSIVGPHIYSFDSLPSFLMITGKPFTSPDAAWSALAIALRPVFDSVAPVLFEEAAKHVDSCADALESAPCHFATPSGIRHIAAAIRRLAAKEGM